VLVPATNAQWLDHPTPGIPRRPDGKPNLTAPAPRTADGKPDFSGLWQGPTTLIALFEPDAADVLPWAKEVARQRRKEFFRSRPDYQCLPAGPEAFRGMKRVVQTPTGLVIENENQTYRHIFMDGRTLEASPYPTWMGYSVGRWDGDTLVIDSVGFNDRTWLNNAGLPHTEDFRMTERWHRENVGHVRIDVTYTDPAAYRKPLSFMVDLVLAADTEMIEAVCEVRNDHWAGSAAEFRKSAISVAPDRLSRYVGIYSGNYGGRVRTVQVMLNGGELSITGVLSSDQVPIIPQSETSFVSEEGIAYKFTVDAAGVATQVEEIHTSGNYPLKRTR
jgi:hypothetical protein